MAARHILRGLPGVVATLLIVLATTGLAVTGTASLFYEGWGQPFLRAAAYLVKAVVLLALGLVALRRPAAGGVLLLIGGVAAGWRWASLQMQRGMASFEATAFTVLILVGPIVAAAALFLLEARHRRLLHEEGVRASPRWLGRHWHELLLLGLPAAGAAILAAQQLPGLLARHDDGLRGTRVIAGNGVTLVWAPRGPGWNARGADGESPSWNALARGGDPPRGRCAYLDEAGTAMLGTPAGVWRLPTADEIVRSLSRGGSNAGCEWDGRMPHATCRTPPDKETPLWAPDDAPIYYWSGREADADTAFAVNYTGGISVLPRAVAGLGIGFRCVKAIPAAGEGQR